MIRLTLLLLVGIGISMQIFGDTSGMPQGSDDPGPEVTRSSTASDGFLTKVGALVEAPVANAAATERVPLNDELRAIEIALAATVTPDAPAPASPRTVKLVATGDPVKAVPVRAASEVTEAWFVTGTRVNLRAGPSTSESIVGRVSLGQAAEVLDRTANGWFRIRTLADGETGYIYGKFLSEQRPG